MKLQEVILDARAASSRYELEGNPKCKEIFDSAFFRTIRTVRPDLADELQPQIQVPRPAAVPAESNTGADTE